MNRFCNEKDSNNFQPCVQFLIDSPKCCWYCFGLMLLAHMMHFHALLTPRRVTSSGEDTDKGIFKESIEIFFFQFTFFFL